MVAGDSRVPQPRRLMIDLVMQSGESRQLTYLLQEKGQVLLTGGDSWKAFAVQNLAKVLDLFPQPNDAFLTLAQGGDQIRTFERKTIVRHELLNQFQGEACPL